MAASSELQGSQGGAAQEACHPGAGSTCAKGRAEWRCIPVLGLLLTYLHFVVFGFVEAFLGLFTLQVMVQHVPVQKVVEKQASLN